MRDRSTSVKPSTRRPVADVREGGTNVLFDMWLVGKAVNGLLDGALHESGLTADEFGVYSVLNAADALTPSALARWLSAPATTVSSYVKRLEHRGHVRREPNPADGRSYLLRLTPAGRAAHRTAGAAFLPVLDDVVADLGADDARVRTSLARLLTAMDRVSDARSEARVGGDPA